MAVDDLQQVTLRDDFYKDGFGKIVFILLCVFVAISLLIAVSFYNYLQKPAPVVFVADKDWRTQPDIPVTEPYPSTPELLQWVSSSLSNAFVYDFNHYNDQLKAVTHYFTSDGWKVFLNQLNIYANYNNVQTYKMFINGAPSGAPSILRQGLYLGRYAWWVQIPMDINYAGYNRSSSQSLTLQVLVVRVPTTNNLSGLGIDNVIVANATENKPAENG
jgi:intracellular multiplication protein IcmL